jgi:transcriptional regulator GlxA family with amidase domain
MDMIDKSLAIAVLVYDGVEAADYVNPMAVFEKTNDYIEHPNTVSLISKAGSPAAASNGTLVGPAVPFERAGDIDILVVPGGTGVISAMADRDVTGFIRDRYESPALAHVLSVCSGSYLLAEAGLLDGKEATVTARLKDDFIRRYPKVGVVDRSPVVADGGRIVTSGQIFMGIGTAYWLVERLYGNHVLLKVRARLGF